MHEIWLPIKDIPAEGREFSFSDPAIWIEPCEEFGLVCAMVEPLEATLQVLPQRDGLLLRGTLRGVVSVPCDRCAEDARVEVDHRFDEFEPLGPEPEEASGRRVKPRHAKKQAPQDAAREEEGADPSFIRETLAGPELDVGAVLWEQFLLTLPVKPLCREDCKGLCPVCGRNRNLEDCGCPTDEGDPRLAPLRDMRLS